MLRGLTDSDLPGRTYVQLRSCRGSRTSPCSRLPTAPHCSANRTALRAASCVAEKRRCSPRSTSSSGTGSPISGASHPICVTTPPTPMPCSPPIAVTLPSRQSTWRQSRNVLTQFSSTNTDVGFFAFSTTDLLRSTRQAQFRHGPLELHALSGQEAPIHFVPAVLSYQRADERPANAAALELFIHANPRDACNSFVQRVREVANVLFGFRVVRVVNRIHLPVMEVTHVVHDSPRCRAGCHARDNTTRLRCAANRRYEAKLTSTR